MNIYQKRIEIWNETKTICNVHFRNIEPSVKTDKNLQISDVLYYDNMKVEVLQIDSIDAVWYLNDSNPVLLNMADPYEPGGAVEIGSGAQEENIFRRSNYFLTLLKRPLYPLKDEECIYSKDVTIFRNDDFSFHEPRKVSIIASASVSYPDTVKDSHGILRFKKEDYDLEYRKIEQIFKTAKYFGHDSLVLSAYGCGAFKCPAEDVSLIFKDIIKKYQGFFKHIVFAIKAPLGSRDIGNYDIFKKNIII